VATSGIAANLLDGGQTAHSILRIPLKVFKDSVCGIHIKSDLAEMLREADCIIWDEAVMAHLHIFMAIDRTLRDIMSLHDSLMSEIHFGNKLILFGGDFRQILPVIKNGNRSAIVNATIKKAPFWQHVRQFRLIENMRFKSAALNTGVDPQKLNHFSDFLLSTGEGRFPYNKHGQYVDEITLPESIAKNMDELE
jgi:ATP-dependent DNA helicase PIF1